MKFSWKIAIAIGIASLLLPPKVYSDIYAFLSSYLYLIIFAFIVVIFSGICIKYSVRNSIVNTIIHKSSIDPTSSTSSHPANSSTVIQTSSINLNSSSTPNVQTSSIDLNTNPSPKPNVLSKATMGKILIPTIGSIRRANQKKSGLISSNMHPSIRPLSSLAPPSDSLLQSHQIVVSDPANRPVSASESIESSPKIPGVMFNTGKSDPGIYPEFFLKIDDDIYKRV